MKTIFFSFLLFFSAGISAQNAEYKVEYANYKKALEAKDYKKALEYIGLCINYLEKEGINDTTYSNTLFEKAFAIERNILGNKHVYTANSYDFFSRTYSAIGGNDSIVFLNTQKALEIRRELLGDAHPHVAKSLSNLAVLYSNMGEYKKALPLQEKVLEVNRKTFGEEHLAVATSLNNLALLYSNMGQYEKALSLNEQALEIRKKVLGEEHPDVAISLSNLALLYSAMGQYEKALLLNEKALKIYKEALGEEDPEVAISLNNLALLYSKMGQYEKALPLQELALMIDKKVLGEEHPKIATSLNNLALLYSNIGQYEKALPLNELALRIYKKSLGEEHPDFATSLNNLGFLYSEMGEYEKALPLNEQALEIRKKAFGKEHPDISTSLNNLAVLYSKMGQYKKALPLLEQALDIYKKVLGEEHFAVATSLNNLALLYSNMGQYERALPLNEQALKIRKKVLGEEHPDYATSLNNLSVLHLEMGQYEKALSLQKQALEISRKALGEEHPDFSTSLSNLAVLYSTMGQYEMALPLQERAIMIMEKTLGESHPSVAASVNNLAFLYAETGQYKNALHSLEQALQIANHQYSIVLPILIEQQKINFLNLNGNSYEFYDALVLDHPEIKGRSTTFSLNNSLLLDNVTLRSNEVLRSSILNSKDSVLISDFEAWLSFKHSYANAKSLSLEEINKKGIDVKAMEDSIEVKERSLSLRSKVFQTEQQKLTLNFETLKSRLTKDEAFLMFHSFNYHNGKSWTDSVLYAAYIVRQGQKEPVFVKLFEQGQLDSLMFCSDVSSMMNNLYQPSDSALYNLLWKPIVSYLDDAKKVYLAPSGLLHKLSFAAIGDGNGQVLSQKYEIHQVLSAQDFIYPSSPAVFSKTTAKTSIAMFGGIKYDLSKASATQQDSVYFSSLSLIEKDLDRGSLFGYLPATQKEIEGIQKQFKENNKTVLSFNGDEATEAAVRSLEGENAPNILHIATHGYFAPDPKVDRNKNQMQLMGQENSFTAADNPLLRSGLLLAGCNDVWQGTATLPGESDGILTAQEVANLNLTNTQLVVLSACETALGDVKGREGVFGLQRAFRLAGVKYLLLSLWRIPDEETSEYMQLYYSELLKQNDITKAYKTTQSSMRQKYPNSPMKWAGMVLVE